MLLDEMADGRKDRVAAFKLIALVWVLVGLLYLSPYVIGAGRIKPGDWVSHLTVTLMGVAITLGLFPYIRWCRSLSALGSVALIGAAIFAIAGFCSMADIYLFDNIRDFFGEYEPSIAQYYNVRFAGNFAVYFSQFGLAAALIWTVETNILRKSYERALIGAKASADEAQTAVNVARLSALRYQLNPHFLFNCLNSISSLVMVKRAEEAESMLEHLSDFLRATLTDDTERLPTLDTEFQLIRSYLRIEGVRFGDRLAFEIECPADLRDAHVPSLILQPLIENAVKYGVARSSRPVTITIAASSDGNDLHLTVSDDGSGETGGKAAGLGVGMRNVRERLDTLYPSRSAVEVIADPNGFSVRLRMPLTRSGQS